MKPARRVVTRSPYRMVGMVCCPWLQSEQIEHESLLERRFILTILGLPGLRRIQHQPFRLELPDNGNDGEARQKTYVPDFLIEFGTGHQSVIEVKPEAFLAKSKPTLNAASQVLASLGHTYFVVTDTILDALVSEFDIVRVHRLARETYPQDDIDAALTVAEHHVSGISIEGLCKAASVSAGLVTWLIARGLVYASTPFALQRTTTISSLSSQEKTHVALRIGSWLGTSQWRALP